MVYPEHRVSTKATNTAKTAECSRVPLSASPPQWWLECTGLSVHPSRVCCRNCGRKRLARVLALSGGGRRLLLLAPSPERGAHARRHLRLVIVIVVVVVVGLARAQGRLEEGEVPDAHPPPLDRRTDAVPPVPLVAARGGQALARGHKVGDAALVARHQAARERVVVLVLDSRHPSVQYLPRVRRPGQRL